MKFLNNIALIAEEEGHHPDMCISYNKLDISIFTHAVVGLSENDFIMAAKIDKLIDNQDPNKQKIITIPNNANRAESQLIHFGHSLSFD